MESFIPIGGEKLTNGLHTLTEILTFVIFQWSMTFIS